MPDDIRVSILDALQEYDPSFNPQRSLKTIFVVLSLVSIACAAALVTYSDGWSVQTIQFYKSKNNFFVSTMDCFLLSLVQAIILPLIAWGGIRSARGIDSSTGPKAPKGKCCSCFRCFKKSESKYASVPHSDQRATPSVELETDGGQPLLRFEERAYDTPEGYEYETNRLNKDNRAADEDYLSIRKKIEASKDVWLTMLFICSTTVQVYLGMKCISYEFSKEPVQGPLMGLGVLWINLMAWVLRELVQKATGEEGDYLPTLHPHRLHLHTSLSGHYCDLCGTQCKEGRAYRCKLCDFDLCMVRGGEEGQGRRRRRRAGDDVVAEWIDSSDTLTRPFYFQRAHTPTFLSHVHPCGHSRFAMRRRTRCPWRASSGGTGACARKKPSRGTNTSGGP